MGGLGKPILVSSILLFLALSPAARASDTYVLDIARSSGSGGEAPDIVRIEGQTGQEERLTLTHPTDPRVELPLREPVGIDVNEATGRLLVTDAGGVGGYPGTNGYGEECGNGCGALLEVDPHTGTVTMLAGPEGPGQNLLDAPYGVLVRPEVGDALVSDVGTARIVSVDLKTGVQTQFSKAPYPGGFREPWGLASDPTTGAPGEGDDDILVANTGADPSFPFCEQAVDHCSLVPSEYTFPPPPECAGTGLPRNDGFVLRLSADGFQKRLYCDEQFRRPRDVLVNGDGKIFVVDPITQIAINPILTQPTLTGFGGIFEIDPATGFTQLVAAGGSMETASGIDFNAAGTSLLLADETLHPQTGSCGGGCGGLIDVGEGGAQTVLASRTPQNQFVDPIAVATDHGGSRPTVHLKSVPFFFRSIDRPEGEPRGTPTSITELPFVPVRGESRIVLLCVQGSCAKRTHRKVRGRHGKVRVKTRTRARVLWKQPVQKDEKKAVLKLPEYLVSIEKCVRPKVKEHGRCVVRKRARKHAGAAPSATNKYVAIVAKDGFLGRYQAFTVVRGSDGLAEVSLLNGPSDSGCLLPGAERLTTTPKGKKKPQTLITACPTR